MSTGKSAGWKFSRLDAVFLCVCVGAAGLAGVLGVRPALLSQAEAARLREQISAMEKDDAAQLAEQRTSQEELTRIEAQLRASPVKLVPPDQLNLRIGMLTALAEEHALKVDQIGPGQLTKGTRFTSVPIKLSGVASSIAVTKFLQALHEKYLDTGVAGLKLSGNPADSDKPLSFAVDLVWYAASSGPADRAGPAKSAPATRP